MAEADFLSFLVDETIKLQRSGEEKLSSLELKLKDYSISYFKGSFHPHTQLLRFQTQMGVLDIPVTWSAFNLEDSNITDVILSEDNDPDLLFHVMKASWHQDMTKLLVTHADGFCYIVGLKAGEENHLHDILNPQELLIKAA